uniref:Putative salivary c-type lectin n=2 Tax=Culex tarsalis TaxID=7177 RepID=A0A1Q3FRY7_CULTA
MSFKVVSVVLALKAVSAVLALAMATLVSSSSVLKNFTSDVSVRAGFANSYQRYFVYNEEAVTFFEAWHKCRSHGLRLASVHSALDDVKLHAALNEKDFHNPGSWWIAGTDLGKTGSFVWITDNRPVDFPTGYTNFNRGEPNNGNGKEHCLEVGTGTKWNDVSCDRKNRYICELDICDC